MRTYKLLRNHNGRSYHISVPTEIAKDLPKGVVYTCHLTEEGILYKPEKINPQTSDLPNWVTQNM